MLDVIYILVLPVVYVKNISIFQVEQPCTTTVDSSYGPKQFYITADCRPPGGA